MKRKSISTRTRFEIFKRDEFTCQYCGDHPPKVVLHVDHIVPVAAGGQNDSDNLITSCSTCNLGKSAVSLTLIPQSLKEKADCTQEREKQIIGYQQVMEGKRLRLEEEVWRILDVMDSKAREGVRRDWFSSTKIFLDKLGFDDVYDSMEIALSRKPYGGNKTFLYFCGVCWNKIRAEQNGAR